MAGFMDYFTGGAGGTGFDLFGGGASGMNDLLTAQQQEAIKRQSIMAMAAQLLQAGGRSPQRTSLGQALGQGVMAGQQAQEKGTTGAVNQMLLRSKLDEAKRAQALAGQIQGVFAGGMPTQQDAALAAPESVAGPTGPTNQRAALAQAPTAQINPRMVQAEQYRRAAALSAGDPTKSKAYMDIAEMLSPREKVTGQPFEVTDASGKPIMVQQMESGELRTMAGFGPKRDIVLQNLGGQTVAIDKSQATAGQAFQQTMTPAELANLRVAQGGLNLRQQEFLRGANEIKETPTGFVYVPKTPGGTAMPVMGAGGQQVMGAGAAPTEGQSNAAGFAQRMELSQSILGKLPAGSQPGAGTRVAEAVPFIGGALARSGQTEETQMYDQAAQDWIRAKLRKESGAAIGADEARKEYETYFPVVGDSDAKIKQKAEARRVVTEGMKKSAGKAYTPYVAPPAAGALRPTDIQSIIDSYNRSR